MKKASAAWPRTLEDDRLYPSLTVGSRLWKVEDPMGVPGLCQDEYLDSAGMRPSAYGYLLIPLSLERAMGLGTMVGCLE